MWDQKTVSAAGALVAALVAGLAAAGCLSDPSVHCADGRVCGPGKVCAPAGGCVERAQLDACRGELESADCTLEGVGAGVCRAGVCVVARCGDGQLDPGEGCDDGNAEDADDCTNNCALPSCGDGIAQPGEECDLGDANGDDRACTTRCLNGFCGDGQIEAGVEECDASGANADDSACTTACLRNVCGDGKLRAVLEVCDDGNIDSGDGCRGDCQKVELCGDAFIDQDEACDDGNNNPVDGCDACVATLWSASTIVGGDVLGIGVGLSSPSQVVLDRLGRLYVADRDNHRIRRIDLLDETMLTVAGSGVQGYAGDGGPATSAELRSPTGVAVDGLGNLYIADTGNHRIRRIDASTGQVETVAGTGLAGPDGDLGPAHLAQLDSPSSLALDGLGNLYVADTGNHRVRRIDAASGLISTVAGTGVPGPAGDLGLAASAQLDTPTGVALDRDGHLYIADSRNSRVRRVDAETLEITTVAGSGSPGFSGDGGAATAANLSSVNSVAVDPAGNLYLADLRNHRIRRVDASSKTIETIAGSGATGAAGGGYSGDGGPATSATLGAPAGVAVDGQGNVYIADTDNDRLRWVDASTDNLLTLAGSGEARANGDAGAATSARLSAPSALAFDSAGNLYIADAQNHRVRRVDAVTGTISTFAGSATAGYSGDGGPATSAQLTSPQALAFDIVGDLYIADALAHVVRRVDVGTDEISTVAGNGTPGFSGDGNDATLAQLRRPTGLALDQLGNLYISDAVNHRIRRVAASDGAISTIAGTGVADWLGDGAAASAAALNRPAGLAMDVGGNLYIADRDNNVIRRIDASSGRISTVAGDGSAGFSGDDGPAIDAQLSSPRDVAVDIDGTLLIADAFNDRVRRVDGLSKVITTAAGSSTAGFSGDGGAAASAELVEPEGVGLDSLGNVYVAGPINNRIRRIDAVSLKVSTVAGQRDPEGVGPVALARLVDARALVSTASFSLVAGGTSGTVEALRDAEGVLEVVVGRYPHAAATADLARYRDASFGTVSGLAYDDVNQRVFIAESSAHRIHVVSLIDPQDEDTWTIASLANDAGIAGSADGAAAVARFENPTGLHYDSASERLYVADTGNHIIRLLDLSSGAAAATVSTVAGTARVRGGFGDGGAATDALLHQPRALAVCPNGDLFIADTANHRIRRVAAGSQLISTVLGDDVAASSGQGFPAIEFPVDSPRGLACDALGNVYVSSTSTVKLLPADDTGKVDGAGYVYTIFGAPPRHSFPDSVSFCLTGLAVLDAETVQVTDSCTGMLIELWLQPS